MAAIPSSPNPGLPEAKAHRLHHFTLALAGNPNAGKTTLFNKLTGLRAKTANFPGTTIERRIGRMQAGGRPVIVVDLPGLYSLESTSPEERIAAQALSGGRADAVLLVVDATNLERNLFLVSQMLELQIPTVVALNMMDVAHRHGLKIDPAKLKQELGCPVVAISARTGAGVDVLQRELARLAAANGAPAEFFRPGPLVLAVRVVSMKPGILGRRVFRHGA